MILPVNFTRPFGLNPIVIIIKKNFLSGGLSISQKQAVIKLIEKKGRDKRLANIFTLSTFLQKELKNIYHH